MSANCSSNWSLNWLSSFCVREISSLTQLVCIIADPVQFSVLVNHFVQFSFFLGTTMMRDIIIFLKVKSGHYAFCIGKLLFLSFELCLLRSPYFLRFCRRNSPRLVQNTPVLTPRKTVRFEIMIFFDASSPSSCLNNPRVWSSPPPMNRINCPQGGYLTRAHQAHIYISSPTFINLLAKKTSTKKIELDIFLL